MKFQEKKASDKYTNVAVTIGLAAMVSIVFSPSILITCGITAATVTVVHCITKRVEELHTLEK